MIKIIIIALSALYLPCSMALEPLGEEELHQVLGQGGVYLSGDITINEAGGPLNVEIDTSNPDVWQDSCNTSSTNVRCGARIAVNAGDGDSSGWLVLDNIRGRFSFEGMTLTTRTINSGFDNNFDPTNTAHDPNDAEYEKDGVAFNRDVLEIGLPYTIKYSNVSFTLANSNFARPTDTEVNSQGQVIAEFAQTDILSVKVDGDVSLRGNLLLFPTGNP
jgi:hypothetical protein